MGILSKFTSKFAASTNKLSGRTDYLEAAAAVTAYVASADGTISDSEIDKGVASLKSIESIKSFGDREIDACLDRMFEKAKGGRMGRRQLLKEIEDVGKDPEMAEAIVLIGLDVADDGGIGEEEMKALRTVAEAVNVNLDKLL